jgi:hypothetical protein
MATIYLEDILTKHFGCKKMLTKKMKVTKDAWRAYGQLISLLYDLSSLTDVDVTDMVETLDNIIEEKY